MNQRPWAQVPLKEIGSWYGGGTPSKAHAEYWQSGSVPWLSPKDMGPEILTATQDLITETALASSAAKLVPPGSVAIVVRSGILERTLPIALVPFATTLNQDMKAIVPRPGVDPRWLAWGLRASELELLLHCRKAGTTVASLDTKRLQEWPFPVPAVEEQRHIVDILEDHLSRLDAAEAGLGRATSAISTLESLLLQEATRNSGRIARLGELAVGSGYGTSEKCIVGGPGPAVVRIPNLVAGQINLGDEKRVLDASADVSRLMLEPGDLLIVRTNGSRDLIGRTAVVQPGVEAAFASYLIRFRLDRASVEPEWVRTVLEAPGTRRRIESLAASSAGQYNLSLSKLASLEVPVPNLDSQRASLVALKTHFDALSRIRDEADQSIHKSAALRRSLMKAAFSGRLTADHARTHLSEELASV